MAAVVFRRGLRDHGPRAARTARGPAADVALPLRRSSRRSWNSPDHRGRHPEPARRGEGVLRPRGAIDLTSGGGFVDTELFSIVLPAPSRSRSGSARGPGSLAGEEESGPARACSSRIPSGAEVATVRAKGAAVGVELLLLALVMAGWRCSGRPRSLGSTFHSGASSAVLPASVCSASCTAGSRSRSGRSAEPRARDRCRRGVRRARRLIGGLLLARLLA